jgi:hypothetical protein
MVRPRQHFHDSPSPTDVISAGDGDTITLGNIFQQAKHVFIFLGNNNGGMVAGYIFQDPLQK